MQSDAGDPVSLALVTLVRDADEMGEGLTRLDGTRFFPAEPSGRYRLLVRRAGFEPYVSAEFRVPADTAHVRIEVPARRLMLRDERAVGARECRFDRLPALTRALWEQAYATVRSAELAAVEGLETIAIRRYERTFDRDGNAREETLVDGTSLGVRLFRTRSSAELSRDGFAGSDPVTGLPVLFGPDLAYLTSREFRDDHCFGVVEGRDATAGMLGLAFEPREGRRLTELGGTMWFDRDAAELRFIDFGFRGGPARNEGGGQLAFERLPSGVWIVRDWSLRAPVLTQAGQLLGAKEERGEALQVSAAMLALADSIANSRKPPGRLNGVVMDSLVTRPLARARVAIDSAGPAALTDSNGFFSIRSVPAGFHRVTVTHPLLDSIGTPPPRRVVRIGPDSTTHVTLGGPTLTTLKGGACDDSLAVLTGVVRDVASGTPIDSATVTLSWIEILFTPNRPLQVNPVELEVPTDPTGRYAACVPARLETTVSAARGPHRTGRVDVRPDDRKLSIQYLSMDRSTSDSVVGAAVIRGVVMYQDRTPLAGAQVTLTDPERTVVTDSAGRFRFASIPGGTRVLDTRALGHAPMRTVVDARVGDTTVTAIFLRKVTQLDAVVVRASAGAGSRAVVELEERRRSGSGYRLTPLELLNFKHSRMDAVVRALPFVRVQWRSGGARILLNTSGGRFCEPTVWIDGRRSNADILGDYPANEVLAVEFFRRPSETPFRYRTYHDCGTILLWTRSS